MNFTSYDFYSVYISLLIDIVYFHTLGKPTNGSIFTTATLDYLSDSSLTDGGNSD